MYLIHVKMNRTLRYSIYKHIYHINNVNSCAPLRTNNVKVKFCQLPFSDFESMQVQSKYYLTINSFKWKLCFLMK